MSGAFIDLECPTCKHSFEYDIACTSEIERQAGRVCAKCATEPRRDRPVDEIRRLAFDAGVESTKGRYAAGHRAGSREMRELATNALAAAGHPPEIFGIVAALPVEDDLKFGP